MAILPIRTHPDPVLKIKAPLEKELGVSLLYSYKKGAGGELGWSLIYNDGAKGKPVPAGLPAITGGCLSCHGRDGELDNAKAKMNCSVCHDDKLDGHP